MQNTYPVKKMPMEKGLVRKWRCEKRTYRIDPSRICFFKFILEAYDGMAQLTTLDPALGLMNVYVAPGCAGEFEELVSELKKELLLETVDFRGK